MKGHRVRKCRKNGGCRAVTNCGDWEELLLRLRSFGGWLSNNEGGNSFRISRRAIGERDDNPVCRNDREADRIVCRSLYICARVWLQRSWAKLTFCGPQMPAGQVCERSGPSFDKFRGAVGVPDDCPPHKSRKSTALN